MLDKKKRKALSEIVLKMALEEITYQDFLDYLDECVKRKRRHSVGKYDHFVGCYKATMDDIITREELERWYANPYREFICVFCGTTTYDDTIACQKCSGYKGIMPKVEGEEL